MTSAPLVFGKSLLILSFLLSPCSAFAWGDEDFWLAGVCSNSQHCANPPAFLKNALSMCEISLKAAHCDDVARQYPEAAALIKKCDPKSYCQQSIAYQRDVEKACARGYANAAIDLAVSVKDMGLAAGRMAKKSWQEFDTEKSVKELGNSIDTSWEKFKKIKPWVVVLTATSPVRIPNLSAFELTEDQRDHLRQMRDALAEEAHKTKVKYACYTPIARAELECYAFGTIVDPTMVLGYAAKMLRAAKLAGELSKAARETSAAVKVNSEIGAGKSLIKTEGVIHRTQFVEKYLYYSPTTTAQNESWIHLAESAKASDKVKFVNFENAEMQNLNNTMLDKNLVTSLTNYHKEVIFNKVEALKKEFPGVKVEVYSDYKSARFAFKGQAPPDFQKRLAQAFAEANQDFNDTLIENKIVRSTEAPSPDQWVRAGSGDTADQANFATRYSRKQDLNHLQNFSDPDVQQHMKNTFKEVEDLRSQITKESPKSMVQGSTLDADAFNIVKKGDSDTNKIRKALSQRFGAPVSESTVKNIQTYIKKVDEFSPDLYIPKREVATLVDASHGGISADMAGMGAQNIRATAEALATSENVERALAESRLAEKKVTEGFNSQKGGFNNVVAKALGPGKVKTLCSGDDCVSIAKTALTDTDKSKILQGLADEGYSSKFRLSFIPEGIKDTAARTNLATHGENIEKLVQKNLAKDFPPAKLKGLIFGVDMKTQELNKGSVQLITGSTSEVRLTVSEKAQIQRSFQKAVQQMNEELRLQRINGAYEAVP